MEVCLSQPCTHLNIYFIKTKEEMIAHQVIFLEIPAVEEESTEAKAGVTIGASISVTSSERGARLDWRYTGGTTPTPLGPGTLSLVERLSSSHFLKILLNRNNLKLAIH